VTHSKISITSLFTKTADTYPEEYASAGNLGALAGGTTGAIGGAALGDLVARHIGHATRQKHLLMSIPGTGLGESLFNWSKGPVIGEALGAAAGGAIGAGVGKHTGQLAALRRGGAPHRLVNQQGQVDPRLMQYLQGQ
jgi:uncharacterized membrane protein